MGNVTEKVTGNISLMAEGTHNEKVGSTYVVEAGSEVHLKGDAKVVIDSGVEVCLSVGGNFISINPAGVTIVGTIVMINSGGAAVPGTPVMVTAPAEPDTDPPPAPSSSK